MRDKISDLGVVFKNSTHCYCGGRYHLVHVPWWKQKPLIDPDKTIWECPNGHRAWDFF